jgi:hypothetical protein
MQNAEMIVADIMRSDKHPLHMLYDRDRSRNIEKIDNIVTVFACRHIKCKKHQFGPCESSRLRMPDPPKMLNRIRHDNIRSITQQFLGDCMSADKDCNLRDQFVFAMLSLMLYTCC